MSATEHRLQSVRRHLDVFEEAWQAEHTAAMRCRDFEDFLAEATMLFRLMDRLIRGRRADVFRGLEEPDPHLDQLEQDLYRRWLELADREAAAFHRLEQEFGRVEGGDIFRQCRASAQSTLAHWTPPVPALAVGSRVLEFSEDDADQIHRLLDQAAKQPGQPAWTPQALPPGDPSLLR